ncbi:MAG: thioesterase family protein [Kofleriaceae bacterium]|nr:thioesterase family protein [Kofleriaceae bacterium]MBP9168362.1 thioesterase family protein [Kofleriaceae bacterium]MBP9857241.1 thioesterase family protein [Kofleriaceae bacterium]
MVASLYHDTTPTPIGAHFELTLGTAWDFLLPSGGVVMTAALRAAAAAIASPDHRLLSATATFCEPIAPGTIELHPQVLRRGAAAIMTRTALHPPGGVGCEVTATFARDRVGPDVIARPPPAVPPPADCADLLATGSPLARARFFANLEVRLAAGTPLFAPGFAAGPARYARWFRYRAPAGDGVALDRLALPPIVDTMPAALTQAIGPTDYRFYAPSVDLTVHVVDDTDREWVLVEATLGRARSGWANARVELWDDRGRYLAAGCQTMYLRTVAGTPPTVDASDRWGGAS